jgi:predicted nucleotidyltransferase
MDVMRIPWPQEQVARFCQRWSIIELALFGSALRPDCSVDSDVDLLVSFAAWTRWSLLDHIQMEEELATILGRKVDLVTRRAVERSENWIRRKAILESAEVVYVAR